VNGAQLQLDLPRLSVTTIVLAIHQRFLGFRARPTIARVYQRIVSLLLQSLLQ
jgi:hypothetical protein